jgi:hypothetical protein
MAVLNYRLRQRNFRAIQLTQQTAMEAFDFIKPYFRTTLTINRDVQLIIQAVPYTLVAKIGDFVILDNNNQVLVRNENEFFLNFRQV